MYDKNDGIREYFPRAGEPAKPLRLTLKLGPIHLEPRTRSVGGEVDWQGLRCRVGGQRNASRARLSVGLRSVQVDVFVGCHCCGFFGSFERCGLYAQPDYLPTGTIVPTIHSTLPSSAIHYSQQNAPSGSAVATAMPAIPTFGTVLVNRKASERPKGETIIRSRDPQLISNDN